eukprot:4154384-Amphidinium_carterae.1
MQRALEQPLPPGFSCVQLEIEGGHAASAWVGGVFIPGSTARNSLEFVSSVRLDVNCLVNSVSTLVLHPGKNA